METAQVIVNLNLNNPDFDVNLFAKKMGQSRTVFFSKIKKITGQSPNDLILTIRLKKAAEILIEDYTKNISEISYLTGFNSPQYFARCFKDHFGVSPSNYGKRNAIEENESI
jgi:AraC-like DNA-binding protein